MKAGQEWSLLRWTLAGCFLSTATYVTIPDYPWGTPLFTVLAYDPNGWLHEMFYIATFFAIALWLTYIFEERSLRVRRLRLWERVRRLRTAKHR